MVSRRWRWSMRLHSRLLTSPTRLPVNHVLMVSRREYQWRHNQGLRAVLAQIIIHGQEMRNKDARMWGKYCHHRRSTDTSSTDVTVTPSSTGCMMKCQSLLLSLIGNCVIIETFGAWKKKKRYESWHHNDSSALAIIVREFLLIFSIDHVLRVVPRNVSEHDVDWLLLIRGVRKLTSAYHNMNLQQKRMRNKCRQTDWSAK